MNAHNLYGFERNKKYNYIFDNKNINSKEILDTILKSNQ